ncbi:MAG TPA: Trp biosynthesis-associated membrane protein [Mycobacteriales bacterium]|nr:Trp biosynthesis-associated membrane protein [Mycobacteriales bacterium]
MSGRRGFMTVLGTAAVAGLLIVMAAGRRWAAATVAGATGSPQHVAVNGHDVAPGLAECGWAVLILAVALIATRDRLRRVAGGGMFVAGVGAAVLVATDVGDVHTKLAAKAFAAAVSSVPATPTAWPWLALVGGVAGAAAGAATLLLSRSWPALGRRYDAPDAQQPVTVDDDAARWAALDRGEDPTA